MSSSPPSATLLLVSAERMLREMVMHHLRKAAPDLTIAEFDSVQRIEPAKALAGAVLVLINPAADDPDLMETIGLARTTLPDSPIAVLANLRDNHVRRLLGLGVRGLVSTQMPATTLIHALRILFAGGDFMSPTLLNDAAEPAGNAESLSMSSWDSLSKTEQEILLRLNQGKPNKVIGSELRISENTVKTHLRQLMRRFGARNRVELVLKTSGISRSPRISSPQSTEAKAPRPRH